MRGTVLAGGKEGWICGYVGKKAPWLAAELRERLQQTSFDTVTLHHRGERGPSAEGQAGDAFPWDAVEDAFPRDAVEEVVATGIKTLWGWRWG